MPAQLSYPGVYVEEIPSGVRTITGVATSIAAFLGRASRGPVNQATTIFSFADYERQFGGLAEDSMMSFAVRDFFLNGGATAVVVRLFEHSASGIAAIQIPDNTTVELTVQAKSAGAWGNDLRVRITQPAGDMSAIVDQLGLSDANELYNVSIFDGATGQVETHQNVTVVDSPRRLDRVLENDSQLVNTSGALPATLPVSASADPGDDEWATNTPATNYPVTVDGSNGGHLTDDSYFGTGMQTNKQGLYALEQVDLFNLLCLPPDWDPTAVGSSAYPPGLVSNAVAYCEKRNAIFLIDPDTDWSSPGDVVTALTTPSWVPSSTNAALYYPRLVQPNPFSDNQPTVMADCGAIAGIIARTDTNRGIWKAPAGLDATLRGVPQLEYQLSDGENGQLNQLGVNCLRAMPLAGRVVWGARTLRGADQLASEWKYLPVRRMALFLKESLRRGLQWVVYEPNDEPLWAEIRLNIDSFMETYFRLGAFQGQTKRDAYLVKCDAETTTQQDINQGIVNIVVGFAPLKPAEFVIIKLQQLTGQSGA